MVEGFDTGVDRYGYVGRPDRADGRDPDLSELKAIILIGPERPMRIVVYNAFQVWYDEFEFGDIRPDGPAGRHTIIEEVWYG